MPPNLLPNGFTTRTPRHEDAPAIVALIRVCQRANGDEPSMTVDELMKEWHSLDLKEEAVLVLGADGEPAGYADILNRRAVQVNIYPNVPPGPHADALWSFMLAWGEERAAAIAQSAGLAQTSVHHFPRTTNHKAVETLIAAGYVHVRTHYIMEAHMTEPPPAPQWPAGIALRTFGPNEDGDAFYEAGEAAFEDSWNRPPSTKERWLQPTLAENFDPTLWFLPYAEDSGQIAALCLCSVVAGVGEVDVLGVRRSWRRQGLGLAALRHAFGELWRRGVRKVVLTVDAESPTGAPRLYHRAGFAVTQSYHRYEKRLDAER